MKPAPPAPVSTVAGRPTGWATWGLVLAVLLVYLPALRAGFIWDDDMHLTANPRLQSWSGLVEIWTSRWALYYPLTSTTFWVLYRLVGLTAWAYHLVNIVLHAVAALLLWRVLDGFRLRGAWLGAVLFALHPVQVETVAWISELKNTQSLVFLLLSVLALQRSGLLPDNQWRDGRAYGWSLALYFCALMSKSAVATFPAVLVVLLWWKKSLRNGAGWRWLVPYFLPSLLFAGWTIWEQRYNSGAAGFEWGADVLDRLVTAARLVVFYFNTLLWPDTLMFVYPSLQLSAADLRSWMPLLALVIVLLGLLINLRDWGRPLLAAALCYGLLLFPVLGFFNIYYMRYSGAADHFQYLASIPLLALAGFSLQTAVRQVRQHAPGYDLAVRFGIGLVVALLGLLSMRHVPVFGSNEALWKDSVRKNPGAWMAQNNLGLLYLDRGELEPAARHFRAALAANPNHYEALSNLGTILFRLGELSGAQASFERALALQPRLLVAQLNLGSVFEKRGEYAEAERCYRAALDQSPGMRDAHARLAGLYETTERMPEAIPHYRAALAATTPDVAEQVKFLQQKAAEKLADRRWRDAGLLIAEAERMVPGDPVNQQLKEARTRLENASLR